MGPEGRCVAERESVPVVRAITTVLIPEIVRASPRSLDLATRAGIPK